MAAPSINEMREELAHQFWKSYDKGNIYPAAFCALKFWQELTGRYPRADFPPRPEVCEHNPGCEHRTRA